MNVPDRKFYPIPATHAVKYIAQVVANRVRRDSHEPGDVPSRRSFLEKLRPLLSYFEPPCQNLQ